MHIPVLFNEVIEALNPQPGHLFIDGTFGAGGHSQGLLDQGAMVLAFDQDNSNLAFVREKIVNYSQTQLQYVHANFADMGTIAPEKGFDAVDGVLLDLGVSSMQFDNGARGFSFRETAPLDMRMDQSRGETAADLVNTLSAEALADLFWQLGEERNSRRIAKKIVAERPLETTSELAALVESVTPRPKRGRGGRRTVHPATKVFQALRIAVNRELDVLERGLTAAITLLKPGGRIAVISFHSLEDRIVKQKFRRLSDPYYDRPAHELIVKTDHIVLKRVTRKPIVPTAAEIENNPRSRSAKLRVAEKIAKETMNDEK